MLTVTLSLDDLRDGKVHDAYQALLDSLMALDSDQPSSYDVEIVTGITPPPLDKPSNGAQDYCVAPLEWRQAWLAFVEGRSERQKLFLRTLERQGEMTAKEIRECLDIAPKGVGGLIGALTRKANNEGLTLPFKKARNSHGVPFWRWVVELG